MLQLIAVCAAVGIVAGVIGLTGIGGRFASLLLEIASGVPIAALVFAMVVAIILGMGVPTTAAYAIAAAVVVPGLTRKGTIRCPPTCSCSTSRCFRPPRRRSLLHPSRRQGWRAVISGGRR